jgi:hypothetical protein
VYAASSALHRRVAALCALGGCRRAHRRGQRRGPGYAVSAARFMPSASSVM